MGMFSLCISSESFVWCANTSRFGFSFLVFPFDLFYLCTLGVDPTCERRRLVSLERQSMNVAGVLATMRGSLQ